MEGKKNGGRRGRKGPAGASESRQGSRLLLLLCGSSAGQPPASVQLQTSVSPAKKTKKTGGPGAAVALFGSIRLAAR